MFDDMCDPSQHIDISIEWQVRTWYKILRMHLFVQRGGVSDLSGKSLAGGFDLHHGILTRKDAQGASWSPMIHSEINCFLLLPEEHRDSPPSREWAWAKAGELYGEEQRNQWYFDWIPYKSGKPPRFFDSDMLY